MLETLLLYRLAGPTLQPALSLRPLSVTLRGAEVPAPGW